VVSDRGSDLGQRLACCAGTLSRRALLSCFGIGTSKGPYRDTSRCDPARTLVIVAEDLLTMETLTRASARDVAQSVAVARACLWAVLAVDKAQPSANTRPSVFRFEDWSGALIHVGGPFGLSWCWPSALTDCRNCWSVLRHGHAFPPAICRELR